MSWVLTVVGIAFLVLVHELGHFVVAKAVGMRVERFALFFPPYLLRWRRGETEYALGSIPLGGLNRITGMSPREQIPPEVAPRAYFRQPVWKRVAVVAAGPIANVLLAFLVLWGLFWANGLFEQTKRVDRHGLRAPAAQLLRPGDRIVAVDGVHGGAEKIAHAIGRHHCAGPPTPGCEAVSAARLTIERGGQPLTLSIRPRYDPKVKHTRLGFQYRVRHRALGPASAARESLVAMWRVTSGTVSAIVRIFEPAQRKQLSGLVGVGEVTKQAFSYSLSLALNLLAIISLSLALVNLFPFLPLDGGHIFWALVEKVRGRAVPFAVMERAGVVGFMLIIMLFLIGLSNDIGRLQGQGFQVR